VSFAIGALALPWVLALELNSDFQAMLPESAPSVRDLDEIRQRFGGTSTLTLAVQVGEGGSIERAREFVRALVPRIEAMHDHQVTSVDWNVHDFETFVEDHRFLYASLDDLNEMRQSLDDRLEYERARANPFYVDLDDEPPPDPEAVIHRMEEDARQARAQMDRFPEGFYQHPSRPILLVFIRTAIRGGEAAATDGLIAAVEDASDAVLGEHARERRGVEGAVGYAAPGLRIDFGGDLMDVREETEALKEAVERSTIVTAVLLCAVIYLFYLRKRAIPLLALVLVPPVLVTFGLAEVFVDYLNASTAFLGSIVVGNGVNASVIWLGRYFEERREGAGVERAIAITHRGTWSATMAASFAAALSYGSLIVTDYRGFRDFGIIGGIGMVLCWVATYTVLPSLATVSERLRPLVFSEREKRMKGVYGVLSARIALGAPRVVLAVSLAVGVVFLVALAHRLSGSVLEYDFRQLQADRSAESRVHMVSELVGDTVEETRSGSALAILAPRVEDVAPLRAQLDAYAAEHPGRIGPVRSIADLLPSDQEAKVPVLAELRRLLLEVRPHLSETQQQQVDENLPPETVTTVGLADLPESVARPFTERDGTRGRLLFVEHAPSESTWDGRYLIRWAEAARTAHTSDGHAPAIAGAAVVFADLLTAIYADGVKAIGVSLFAVALLVFFSFRRNRERGLTMGALMLGVVWMAGALALIGARLNFLNLVAFPITFGIGVDYSVNVIQRLVEETERDPRGALRRSLEGAGGAVILCSLTTIIGYISLFASTNRAINSFGLAMTLSEITCLTTAVIVLPALMQWFANRAAARVAPEAGASKHGASTDGAKPTDA
jgi:predicted RND superfamily exporter protein